MKSSDERVQAMLRGRRAIRRVPLPGLEDGVEGEIGIRILQETEVDECRSEALQVIHTKARGLKLTPEQLLDGQPELLTREAERQMVFRAIVDVDTIDAEGGPKPFFVSPMAIRQADTVLVETLWQLYMDHQDHVNPLRGLSQAEVDELADTLGKGHAAKAILGLYDAPSLRNLVRTLASQLASAPSGR